jgi:Zn-finger nucleic acid-binding protein
MQCPACLEGTLDAFELDDGPAAQRCPRCRGLWIPARCYWDWAPTDAGVPPLPSAGSTRPVEADTDKPKPCPDCGRIISVRRKVAPGESFLIDRCSNCGGFWLDDGEWAQLASIGLHRALHMLTSDIWQARVRTEDIARSRESQDRALLGDEMYAKLLEMKTMIDSNPNRSFILAFLKGERES